MLKFLKILTALALAALSAGCECVPDINTPKTLTPSDFSDVLFINVTNKYSSLSASYNGISIAGSIENSSPALSYCDVACGYTNIRLKSGDYAVFNAFAELTKDLHYSMLIYELNNVIRTMIIQDEFQGTNSQLAYFRIAHLSENSGDLIFSLKNGSQELYSVDLSIKSKTEFTPSQPGNYSLEVRKKQDDSAVVATAENIRFSAGKLYTLILKKGIGTSDSYVIQSTETSNFNLKK